MAKLRRCEDYPCCGHHAGECPTGDSKKCPDCGRLFSPTSGNEKYCLACGSRPFGVSEEEDFHYGE